MSRKLSVKIKVNKSKFKEDLKKSIKKDDVIVETSLGSGAIQVRTKSIEDIKNPPEIDFSTVYVFQIKDYLKVKVGGKKWKEWK